MNPLHFARRRAARSNWRRRQARARHVHPAVAQLPLVEVDLGQPERQDEAPREARIAAHERVAAPNTCAHAGNEGAMQASAFEHVSIDSRTLDSGGMANAELPSWRGRGTVAKGKGAILIFTYFPSDPWSPHQK